MEPVLAAEYEEWLLRGFLKRTRIEKEMMYNLEFHLTHLPKHLELPIPLEALGMDSSRDALERARTSHTAGPCSKERPAAPRLQMKRAQWEEKEETTLINTRNAGFSRSEIQAAIPNRTMGAIQVRYSTKFSGRASAGVDS
jgi:hypothetical protein